MKNGSVKGSRRSRTGPVEPRTYTIGMAARLSGVSARMIRRYEREGLLPAAVRTPGNYRLYGDSDIQTLRFVQGARRLDFSTRQLRELLSVWADRKRSGARVRSLALEHIAELDARIAELSAMRATLAEIAQHYSVADLPECPILGDIPQPVSKRQPARHA